MHYQEFIDRVERHAGLSDRQQAVRAIAATLETLGERLSPSEREDLAAQLPQELKAQLDTRPSAAPFSLEEFYNRVRARAAVGYPEAVHLTQTVMAVLQEAVSRGEMADMMSQLRGRYGELFGAPPQGPASPSRPEPVR